MQCNRFAVSAATTLLALSPGMLAVALSMPAAAQQPAKPSGKPPVSQAWIDVATHSSDIPGMGTIGGFAKGGLAGGLGSLLGGASGGGNSFGNTRHGFSSTGRWLDVSVMTRPQPNLAEAVQAIPAGMKLGANLKLVVPPVEKQDREVREEEPIEPAYEKPKGRMLLYWGCGDQIRAGQPRVFDAANADLAAMQKFFGTLRNSTTRGARASVGNPAWPNKPDDRLIPEGASLLGEHSFSGNGIVDNFKFSLGNAQDFMAPYLIAQSNVDGATHLEWSKVEYARGYFISAMGSAGGSRGGSDDPEMVLWTSSDVAELGFALIDYQTNVAIDKWIKEKAVLPATATQCAVPKGIFNGGAMLQAIAYGSEAFFVHPPRPTDPKAASEPQWQSKVRNK